MAGVVIEKGRRVRRGLAGESLRQRSSCYRWGRYPKRYSPHSVALASPICAQPPPTYTPSVNSTPIAHLRFENHRGAARLPFAFCVSDLACGYGDLRYTEQRKYQ